MTGKLFDSSLPREEYERVDLEGVYGVTPYSIWDISKDTKISREIKKRFGEVLNKTTREGSATYYGGEGKRTVFKRKTSIFDPVLADVIVKSYSEEGDLIYDPFCSVIRPYVAAKNGRFFVGCEVREEEVEKIEKILEEENLLDRCKIKNADCREYKLPTNADLIFTCPPYWNYEIYSDDPRDMSTIDNYKEFMREFGKVMKRCHRSLKDKGFLAIVVGNFRDYSEGRKLIDRVIDFRGDVIQVAEENGFILYDDIVVKKPLGSAPSRLKMWNKRKTVRMHEYLLIFKKRPK